MFKKLAYLWNNGNNLKYLTRGVIGSMAAIFINGSILQAFMLENGISEKNVAFFVSILQVVQVSVMLLVSPIVDKFKNIVKICGCVDLSLVAYSLLLGSICLLSDCKILIFSSNSFPSFII